MPQGALAINVVKNSSALGNRWFVNELTGNDSNVGNAAFPFATLDAALNAAVALNGDIVYLMGSSHRTTTLNWNKNGVSLVGLQSPSQNCRSRISVQTVAGGLTQTQFTALHPLVNVTAQGCTFANISAFYGGDGTLTPPTAAVCWAEAGGRNFYNNVEFFGGGDALMAALAGMRSLTIAGSGENLFTGCTIGLDTELRATNANASLELLTGTPRNKFVGCNFPAWSSDAANVFVLVGATGMDRWALFDDCSFVNNPDIASYVQMTAGISASASAGGSIILTPTCLMLGAAAVATANGVYVSGATPAATTSSLAIKAT